MKKTPQFKKEKFNLTNQGNIIDIEHNFYKVIHDTLEELGLSDISELTSSYDKNEEIDLHHPLIFAFSDAIEASIYNAMRDILTYHEDYYYEKNQLNGEIKQRIDKIHDKIDAMHNYDITEDIMYFDLYKSEDGDYIASSEFSIAGIRKDIGFNLNEFYSNESKERYTKQLQELLKEVLIESPYDLVNLLHVEI